ncbi:hypothetical protein DFA_05861 [Cavenderia fasciculata]|uniref:RGS domain-containing protein n=1 Tax=Cavenderia fasciculata TaxID=261658 RepID=F4PN37_CACFS|nr:uncharacterized protein DFA_05861 [Cavenderia fasciculata]EGG23727.1 hypothetical protein DFA_05861 [Cavenderia fasciculata]|eukprot:XP_004361578.1 hypothetical protein DFA_05861 [Cavenderia fasciculata]
MNIIFGNKEFDKEDLKIDLRNLIKLVKDGDTKKVKKILSSKKGKYLLNVPDELDQTCIMVAAHSANLEMFETVLGFFKLLKIDLNLPDKNGYTVLHLLFSMTDLEAKFLILLLEQPDLQLNITNRDLNTPFHYFCQKFRSSSTVKEVFSCLVTKGVNVNAINRNGESPLHKAIFNTTLAPTMLGLLLEAGANVNVTNKNGETGLHYCVRMGRTDLVTLLLKYGADKDIIKDGKTLYDIAIEENFTKLADFLKDGSTTEKNTGSATELITLLQNPTLREDFRQFLREELICEENISFWLDVEAYKHLKIDTALRLFKELYRIYDKYIPDTSPSEINVPFGIKKDIISFIKTIPTLTEIEQQMPPLTLNINHHSNSNSNISNSASNSNNSLDIPSTKTTPTNSPTLTNNGASTGMTPPSITIQISSSPSNSSISSANPSSNSNTPVLSPSPTSSSSSLTPPPSPPVYDFQKIQSVYNIAQQHVFMLMATDSLSKYKKRTRKSKGYHLG